MKNIVAVSVCVLIAIAALSAGLTARWDKADAENNAFAKECNARGGTARWWDGMLQCFDADRPAAKGAA